MAVTAVSGTELAEALRPHFGAAIVEADTGAVWVDKDQIQDVIRYLKEAPEWTFDFLEMVTAADYIDYFELVYTLLSLSGRRRATVKARVYSRTDPVAPSLYEVFKGADFQESEVYDLFGIRFEGHPTLRRIFLWDDFPGWPLRKDFLDFDHRQIPLPG
ncbi:MAG: NADH-quinone oxidoreductase subunit C [Chloroflexi bacterium]|nr:NADH-quinone oxidoreductase subunit C [Chloroflexota bacterium]